MSAENIAKEAKVAFYKTKNLSTIVKNQVLSDLVRLLEENKDKIKQENAKDMSDGKEKGLSPALLDRLELNDARIRSLQQSVLEIISLPDPIGEVIRGLNLPNGLQLLTKRVPIGVLMTIYESRPNVTIDVASLSFKAGNACILRGGSEAYHSNFILSSLFQEALQKNNLPKATVSSVQDTKRETIIPYLKLPKWIDVVVPRGGEGLVRFITEHSQIPVIKHDSGVTNLFVDSKADLELSKRVILNSKTQRPGVCNALENLLLHKDNPDNLELLLYLANNKVDLLLDEDSLKLGAHGKPAKTEDYFTEFLDYRLSVKIVSNVEEAVSFIRNYGSGHTECILSSNIETIEYFKREIDSAAVFVNCSTRFHDGGEFGLGAEVGISTGKLHVRGPMGLTHLTTTTTYLQGNGQVRV